MLKYKTGDLAKIIGSAMIAENAPAAITEGYQAALNLLTLVLQLSSHNAVIVASRANV